MCAFKIPNSSHRTRRSRTELKEENEQLKAEIERLTKDLTTIRQEYYPMVSTVEHLCRNVVRVVEQRNAAWMHENATRAKLLELEQYVEATI